MSRFSHPASSSARRNDCASSIVALISGVFGPSDRPTPTTHTRRCMGGEASATGSSTPWSRDATYLSALVTTDLYRRRDGGSTTLFVAACRKNTEDCRLVNAFESGIELNRRFYDDVVGPIMAPWVHSAALVGWGSDVLGY